MYLSKESKEVRRSISLRMSNVDRRSTVPKFDVITLLEFGNCILFPDRSQNNTSAEIMIIIMFSIFS